MEKLNSIHVLRGLAAVSVVAYHVGHGLANPEFFGREAAYGFGGLFAVGYVGVDVFFVLSGFLLTVLYAGRMGDRASVPEYLWRRFIRILPLYWVATLALVALNRAIPVSVLEGFPGWDRVVSSLLLLPQPFFPILIVAWTLRHELFFYLLFGLALGFGKKVGWFLLALLGIVSAASAVALMVTRTEPEFSWLRLIVNPMNTEFVFGCLAGIAYLRPNRRRYSPWSPLAGLAAVWFFASLAGHLWIPDFGRYDRIFSFGVAAALAVYLFACRDADSAGIPPVREGRGVAGWRDRFLILLGDASFSIYLVHVPVISRLARWLASPEIDSSAQVGIALGIFVAALSLGVAVHLTIERPLLRLLRPLSRSGSPGRPG